MQKIGTNGDGRRRKQKKFHSCMTDEAVKDPVSSQPPSPRHHQHNPKVTSVFTEHSEFGNSYVEQLMIAEPMQCFVPVHCVALVRICDLSTGKGYL